MCLIITRDAGVTFPLDKFIEAYKNNPHGWGYAVPDKGRLLVQKHIPSDGEDVEEQARTLHDVLHTEFKNDQVMLHMRWTTAGETILRNAHPFPVLEFEEDGVDLRMAHNGTIHKYKPGYNAKNKWESDSRVFVREFVRPLFKRMVDYYDGFYDEMLDDKFIYNILSDQIPNSSVLSFIDGYGNTLEVNALGNTGEYDSDGWWVSNTYSFKEDYRKPKNNTATNTANRNGYRTGRVFKNGRWVDPDDEYDYEAWWMDRFAGADTYEKGKTYQVGYTTPPKDDNIVPMDDKNHATDTKTERFSEKYDCTPEELYALTDDWIDLIAAEAPEDLILLIKELLNDCYVLNITKQNLLKKLKEQHDAKAA